MVQQGREISTETWSMHMQLSWHKQLGLALAKHLQANVCVREYHVDSEVT